MLDQIPLQLDREWIKEREDGERGWGEGGDYFKYFHQRRAIIQGRRLIEGRLLVDEIRYLRAGTPEVLDMSAPSKRLFYFAGLFNNLSELELQAKVEV